jgi:TM2 domain-containing membrane protein YozV
MAFEQLKIQGADGHIYGPVDRQTARQWAREGRIASETLVWDAATNEQRTAADMPELAELLAPPVIGAPSSEPATPKSDKKFLVALLCCIFFGWLGVHRFYLGHIGIGLAQLLTCGGCGIWALVDAILIAAGSVKDVQGLDLSD